MSKRGKILKRIKQGLEIFLEATHEAAHLPDKDAKWVLKKIDPFFIEIQQKFSNLECSDRGIKEIKKEPNIDDNLPF